MIFMMKYLKLATLLLILNLIGILGFWISEDRLLGSIALIISIAFSVVSLLVLTEKSDDFVEHSSKITSRPIIGKPTPQDKVAILFLGCVIFLIPCLYFRSENFTFSAIFVIQLVLLLIILSRTYLAFLSSKFISTPINFIHHELENTGTLEQRKIQLTVQYSYSVGDKEYSSFRIRYPFWFVTNKRKLLLAQKIKSGEVINCYVNPRNFKQAVLIKGFEISDIPWYLIYIFFVAFTITMYVVEH